MLQNEPPPQQASILVIEDELSMRELLHYIFSSENYELTMAASGAEAEKYLDRRDFDIVIQDMKLPDIDGIVLLTRIRQSHPHSVLIVITALSGWKTAVDAMRLGAFDYIKKPFDNKNLRMVVSRALQYKEFLEKLPPVTEDATCMLIGNSLQIQKLQDLIRRVALTDTTVLICGESGSGKELVARAIHLNSTRREHVFIPVNCGAISENLIESELFGHVKGAFTDAIRDKKGLFEIANGGTLFLDEIGEMSLSTQVKLLRVLEEKSFLPLGGTVPKVVNVRFIAATNRNLEEQVQKGRFREDLYYRLNVIPIHIPPLRERKEDIPLLAGHFLSRHALRFHKTVTGFSEDVMDLFLSYDWPGNVRELDNLIQRAVLLCEDEIIQTKDLKVYLPYRKETLQEYTDLPEEGFDLGAKVEEFEKFYIKRALERTRGHLTQAAGLLNLSFRSLRYKVKKYKIQ